MFNFSPLVALLTSVVALVLFTASAPSWAVLIRDDVPENRHVAPPSDVPALVDLSPEGHGVLIAPQWVLTAAHATLGAGPLKGVTVNGKLREVEKVVLHPEFKTMPSDSKEWELNRLKAFMLANSDIALVKLKEPVADVVPIAVNRQTNERGRPFAIYGKGRYGTGGAGQISGSNPTRALRVAHNRVESVEGSWVTYTFDADRSAMSLEGFQASGDSGTPLLVRRNNGWEVIGLVSWKWNGTREFNGRAYDTVGYSVRVSKYSEWIRTVTEGAGAK